LIERYASTAKAQAAATCESVDETNAAELSTALFHMGIIASPVTKENAGQAYHQELARELATFLKLPMAQHNGMMTLSDIYCIFNRARGAHDLISPEDLVQAAHLQKRLSLGMHVRTFEHGLMVLQLGAFIDIDMNTYFGADKIPLSS
jgi:ESCRT-II complex subunit VPS36